MDCMARGRGMDAAAQGGISANSGRFRDDVLLWRHLTRILVAAHRGDARTHIRLFLKATRQLPADTAARLGPYLWWLLRYAIELRRGPAPTSEQLAELAASVGPKVRVLVQCDDEKLTDLFGTVWNLAEPDRRVTGGMFTALANVAVGVLVDEPDRYVAAVSRHVTDWYARAETGGQQFDQ
jgi:hypothetical protein